LNGNVILVPPCGQTVKATAMYLLIGCPSINDMAGKIDVYLRHVFIDKWDGPYLKKVVELEGSHKNMKLGTPHSLRNQIQVTENIDSR
jgi:hypothetical protein